MPKLTATHTSRCATVLGAVKGEKGSEDWRLILSRPAAAMRALVDHVLRELRKLGISFDTQNSGDYKDVVAVISPRPEFDFIEMVLRPAS